MLSFIISHTFTQGLWEFSSWNKDATLLRKVKNLLAETYYIDTAMNAVKIYFAEFPDTNFVDVKNNDIPKSVYHIHFVFPPKRSITCPSLRPPPSLPITIFLLFFLGFDLFLLAKPMQRGVSGKALSSSERRTNRKQKRK